MVQRLILIIVVLTILPHIADATTYYVRPASAEYSAENGSDCTNAFDGLSDIAALSAGDVVKVNGTHAEVLTIGSSGTSAAPITYESDTSCGDGAGVINASGLAYGVDSNGKSYVTVTGLECYGATTACFLVGGSAAIRVTYTANTARDTVGATAYGMAIIPPLDATRYDYITISGNTVTRAAYCGIYLIGAASHVTITENTVSYAGSTTECHGISVIPARNFFTGGWTADGGNVYHQAVGAQTYLTTVTAIEYAFYLKTSPFTRTVLTKNTSSPTTPGSGEFGFSGGNLYVNVGENPAGDTGEYIYFVYLWPTEWEVSGNEVSYTQFTSAEGTGIQADDGASYGRILRNYVHDNEGPGVNLNYGSYNLVSGNVLKANARGGINFGNAATANTAANNTLISNGDGTTNLFANIVGTLTSRLTNLYNNNIWGNWGIYANNTDSQVFHDVNGNNLYNYTTATQNVGCTGGGTCVASTTYDPEFLGASDYRPRATTLRRAGVTWGAVRDRRNRPGWSPPDIGAYQSSSGDPAGPRAARQ